MAAIGAVWATAAPALAQQPFVVDDAEVTPARSWHVELSDQVDALRGDARPNRWQNAFDIEVNLGATPWLELGVVLPVISVFAEAAATGSVISGVGDMLLAAKARLAGSADARHAFAASVSVEIPSGDRHRELGSGLVDYGITLVSQHRVGTRWTVRANGAVVLAGNTQTGVVGIKERGTVLGGGSSLVAKLGSAVQLGGEVTLAWSQKATLGGSTASAQLGGNFQVGRCCTLDVGLGTGWFDASSRLSLQVGVSVDLPR